MSHNKIYNSFSSLEFDGELKSEPKPENLKKNNKNFDNKNKNVLQSHFKGECKRIADKYKEMFSIKHNNLLGTNYKIKNLGFEDISLKDLKGKEIHKNIPVSILNKKFGKNAAVKKENENYLVKLSDCVVMFRDKQEKATSFENITNIKVVPPKLLTKFNRFGSLVGFVKSGKDKIKKQVDKDGKDVYTCKKVKILYWGKNGNSATVEVIE